VVRAGTSVWWYCDGTDGFVSDITLDKIKTAAAAVALGGQKLTGVGTATDATDAATLSNKVHEFAAPTAPLAMNAQRITGVADPVDAQDVTTKNWFDTTYSTLAGITADVVTVSGIAADVTTVAADGADIGTVAGISGDVTTVAGVAANVTTVAGISADVTSVADIAADVSTVATNVADITNFADVYLGAAASNPATRADASALQAGDLYFNTVSDALFVYDGAAWQAAALDAGSFVASSEVGTGANQIVRLDGSARLPAVDGSQLTNIPLPAEVFTPTNVTPVNADTDITETPTLTGSTYLSLYGKTQKSSQWQISTVVDFASTAYDSNEVVGVGVTHAVPAGNLSVSQLYYWRVRYRDTDDTWSDWSTATTFTTAASFNDFVATPAAIPSIGASHAGGFYFGQIWDEITTSATSTAIGTGSKTFTVTDAAPLFYSGQAIKIVSRADAGGRVMEGTVTGSIGTTLTVNVTSDTGSGTYTDWSVLVKYRLIVAPKSSGDNASVAFKNANTAAPVATQTLTNGPAATAAMVAADTSTVYPLAHWADGLSIGGFSDWYVPARDELELIWRNLKPVTDDNATSDRSTSDIAYTNGGNIDDLSADTHGVNRHSEPAGAAYTASDPARTSVSAFQSGGAEALAFGSERYWASSEYSSDRAWTQVYGSSNPGGQFNGNKTSAYRARAVRRSLL
jgi:hypothetical protein